MVAKLGISVMGQRMFYTQKSSLLKMICLFYFLAKKKKNRVFKKFFGNTFFTFFKS